MKEIRLSGELIPLVLSDRKTSTIRAGMRQYELGNALLVSGTREIPVWITGVRHCRVDELGEQDAYKEGYVDTEALLADVSRFYPDLGPDDIVTVIDFERR